MNLVIDVGNSLIKTGVFEGDALVENTTLKTMEDLQSFLKEQTFEHVIFSSVNWPIKNIQTDIRLKGKIFELTHHLPIPLKNLYATPDSLGVDRIAGACGAWSIFQGKNSLVIDVGTCINYEFVSHKGEYCGGAISPGIKMRFAAMHDFTSRLPLAEPTTNAPLFGNNTITCLQSGVMNGILEEIKGTIYRYQKDNSDIRVILCGGDAHFFENHLKPSIFVAPELVLKGLNSILLHNVNS